MKWAFTTPVQFVIGWRFHVGAWRALRNGRCAVGTTLGGCMHIFVGVKYHCFGLLPGICAGLLPGICAGHGLVLVISDCSSIFPSFIFT